MKKTIVILLITNLCLSSYLAFQFWNQKVQLPDLSNDIIKVRGIVVVDSLGIERAILASHLPEAQRDGGRMYSSRSQSSVSGLMLYDNEGLERGGYVTDDEYGNIFLTLDSKSDQTAMFLAEPQGATSIALWSRTGNKANFSVEDEGLYINLVDNGKNLKIVEDE